MKRNLSLLMDSPASLLFPSGIIALLMFLWIFPRYPELWDYYYATIIFLVILSVFLVSLVYLYIFMPFRKKWRIYKYIKLKKEIEKQLFGLSYVTENRSGIGLYQVGQFLRECDAISKMQSEDLVECLKRLKGLKQEINGFVDHREKYLGNLQEKIKKELEGIGYAIDIFSAQIKFFFSERERDRDYDDPVRIIYNWQFNLKEEGEGYIKKIQSYEDVEKSFTALREILKKMEKLFSQAETIAKADKITSEVQAQAYLCK